MLEFHLHLRMNFELWHLFALKELCTYQSISIFKIFIVVFSLTLVIFDLPFANGIYCLYKSYKFTMGSNGMDYNILCA